MIGSSIIIDKIILTININGMAIKKVIPKATSLLVFPIRLNTAAINHRNTIETTAIAAPRENTSFLFRKLLSKNK